VACFIAEPIQSEGGDNHMRPEFLQAMQRLCRENDALFVLDEVQSGIGRTGRWFAHQYENVLPDVMTLSKGMAGGLPIGACVGIGDYAIGLTVGQHGSTFGGNPVACAASLAVFEVIKRDRLMQNAVTVGDALAAGIESVDHPLVAGVRGKGLWRALLLNEPWGVQFGEAARAAGFLVSPVRPQAVRLAPPLVLTAAEADEFVAAVPGILDRTTAAASPSR